jgi:hypothetical protein
VRRFGSGAAGLLAALGALLLIAPAADAAGTLLYKRDGVHYVRYRVPMNIKPGQNDIAFQITNERPSVDGYITYFKPELRWVKNKKVPPVDVIHLHHAVWIINNNPTFRGRRGEDDRPYAEGLRLVVQDDGPVDPQPHDPHLTPNLDRVWVEWTIGFIPKNSPAAKGMHTVDTQWMDVVGGAYPVFDVMKGSGGKDQRFVYPNDQPSAYVGRRGRRRTPGQWTVNRDATLVATAGHLHRAACGRTCT